MLLATIGGGSVVALLGIAFLVSVLLRSGSSNKEPSAYVSAVFVGSRRLPVIEGSARGKRRIVLAKDLVPALVGCAIAVVIALLVVHYVG